MNNLSKENFFNEMSTKYPSAMERFCNWVDDYKKSVNWSLLFNSDSNWQDAAGKNAPAPRLHDIPYEMQFGILIKFASEVLMFSEKDMITMFEMKELFESCLAGLEEQKIRMN